MHQGVLGRDSSLKLISSVNQFGYVAPTTVGATFVLGGVLIRALQGLRRLHSGHPAALVPHASIPKSNGKRLQVELAR
ncbi:hypothetical protein EDF88_0861 [Buttiauxella sp. BIGb0552]|nr:hypothetical protein EDF88_0861 [Buttiauxella sp. BIGb0552]